MPVKGRDDGNNLHDVYTTNESLSILQQAIDSGSMQGIDPSLNPVVEAIKESHADNNLTFWQGTEAEFNELGISGEILGAKIDSNGKIYVLTGDTTLSDAVANAAAAAEQVLSDKTDISVFTALNDDYYTFKNKVIQNLTGTLLYSNPQGTDGSVTLSDSINNYDYLIITTIDLGKIVKDYKVVLGGYRELNLMSNWSQNVNGGQQWLLHKSIAVSGSTITINSKIQGIFNGRGDWAVGTTSNILFITKVVGYKNYQ